MDRRIFISTLASMPFISGARAAVPWKAEFISGSFDGKAYSAGLHITLDKGWKTYWRNPGDAGIPPSINISSENIQTVSIDFPLPLRIVEANGEALGYHDDVLFPINLLPKDPTKPFTAQLSSFFGVCEQVCTPAKFDANVQFEPKNPLSELITKWQMRVPQPSKFVNAANLDEKFLILDLNQPIKDIFVEGPDNLYFRAPDFEKESGKAWIKIDGLKNAKDLQGVDLRTTADANGQGLEQHVTVA
jgi:DsbC/DsbD-like thiol-disulfide interchange protein